MNWLIGFVVYAVILSLTLRFFKFTSHRDEEVQPGGDGAVTSAK